MIAITPVTREERPWQQTQRAGTRADRLVRSIIVTIPSPLAAMDLSIPSSIAGELDAAARAVAILDAGHGSDLSALTGLLLRTESVASSKIEYTSPARSQIESVGGGDGRRVPVDGTAYGFRYRVPTGYAE